VAHPSIAPTPIIFHLIEGANKLRHRFQFDEVSANVLVTIDITRRPKKTLPRDTPRDLPHVNALLRLIGEYIERNCRGNDAALTPFGTSINTDLTTQE
jgi:hypothetical protein